MRAVRYVYREWSAWPLRHTHMPEPDIKMYFALLVVCQGVAAAILYSVSSWWLFPESIALIGLMFLAHKVRCRHFYIVHARQITT